MIRKLCLLFLLATVALSASPLDSFAIRYEGTALSVLNQQKLPQEELWIHVDSPEQMHEIITSLKVRGAPMIGIAAICALAQMSAKGEARSTIEAAAAYLRSSRPTAVNLSIYIDRVLAAMEATDDYRKAIADEVEAIFNEDVALCDSMGKFGADLIQPGETILTYCNTGSLATAGIGTAIGVIKTAHAQGKNIHVYTCETRPLLQGGRLTAWEMGKNGIPYTLICDNMAGMLMRQGKIDRVLVGADRIAVNGDFANKIGTYTMAVLAKQHGIPFHVVAPYTTIDPKCPSGDAIVIEQRAPQEVRGVSGGFGSVCWSPVDAPVYNPAFDVTPADLVTSYILDCGIVLPNQVAQRQ